jgi:hypothetical protein
VEGGVRGRDEGLEYRVEGGMRGLGYWVKGVGQVEGGILY